VIVRHPNGWASYYTHLSSLAVARDDDVAPGQQLGIIGGGSAGRQPPVLPPAGLSEDGARPTVVDSAPHLRAWLRVQTAGCSPRAPIVLAPRNARLVFRPVGDRCDLDPEWLRPARGSSRVYVARQRNGPVSTSGNLRPETLRGTRLETAPL